MLPSVAYALLGLPLSAIPDGPGPGAGEGGAAKRWELRDYVSPGLHVVRPDACFPHMRAGDLQHHPWKYLRRDVPHLWYADERYPLMGFLNRDEATLLHNIGLQFAGKRVLEIGSWLGWSTCHLALAGTILDVIDPAHDDPSFRAIVEASLACSGVLDRVHLAGGQSPDAIGTLARRWSLFFIDGDHESPAPARDALACLPYAEADCAFVFHDLASPAVADGLRALADRGFQVVLYQTAQIMGMAWRGDVTPVAHAADPDVAWQMPPHLRGWPVSGLDFEPTSPVSYRQFRDVLQHGGNAATLPRPSVCIVTNEIIGPFKNGGIGTAMTGLAELLASEGFPVTVLYTGGIWSPDINLGAWRSRYLALGIVLDSLTIVDMKTLSGPLKDRGFGVPWLVDRYLREHAFDIIHFNDCCGEGSLALAAQALGLAHRGSLLAVALHSPSRWVLELNQTLPTSLLFAAYHYAEKLSVGCAGLLWSPSRYLLDWVAARDFVLPEQTFVQQYTMPSSRLRKSPLSRDEEREIQYGPCGTPDEIVFFGRLEERKGLRLFCNAIHLLRDELARRSITVTFLGKPERCAGMPSLEYVAHRSASWTFPVRTVTDLGQPEALQYLSHGAKLAVMPSPFDNSPCTVYEALEAGIPFLAARTGGVPELVDPADHERVLFHHSTESLRDAIRNAIEKGGWIARPFLPAEQTRRDWIAMHEEWRMFLRPPETSASAVPTVAVVIDHPAGARLDRTLDSLSACASVQRFIIINRGGESFSFKTIDLTTEDPEALHIELAAIAEDAVLLIHSGVAVEREAFETMLCTLASKPSIDGLLPVGRGTRGKETTIIPTLGGCAAFSLFEGVTFAGSMILRRALLKEAMAGRTLAVESPFMGMADFCVTWSERIWPYPEIVNDHAEAVRIGQGNGLPSRVEAYDDASPNDRYYMTSAGYGAMKHERPVAYKRELALAAVNLGLTPLVRIGAWGWRRLRKWIR